MSQETRISGGIFIRPWILLRRISDNVRIDTHEKNTTMQHQVEKNGFTRCGIIYLENGAPRIAYHWSRRNSYDKGTVLLSYYTRNKDKMHDTSGIITLLRWNGWGRLEPSPYVSLIYYLRCCVSCIEKPDGEIRRHDFADLDSTARSSPLAFLNPFPLRNS